MRCMDARAPPSRAPRPVRGRRGENARRRRRRLDLGVPSWTTRSPSPPPRTTLNAHLRRTQPEVDTSGSQQYALGDGALPSRVRLTTRAFYGDDSGAAAAGPRARVAESSGSNVEPPARAALRRSHRGGDVGGHRARGRTSREDVSRSTRVGGDANGATRGGSTVPALGRTSRGGLPKGGRRFTVERVDDREPRGGFGGDPRRARGFEPRPRERPPPAVDFRVRRRRSVSVRRLRGARKASGHSTARRRSTFAGTLVERFGFDRIDSKRLARIRRVARAGTCAGETETEREAAAGCLRAALLERRADPEEDDETLWELGVVEEWLVGTVPKRDRTYDGNDREGDGRAARAARDRRATGSRGV